MPRPLLLLSTCGTSLLTNLLRERNDFGLSVPDIIRMANLPTLTEIPDAQQPLLTRFLSFSRERVATLDPEAAAKASAEINGILKVVADSGPQQPLHYLIATDTYLGQQTAELVKIWLDQRGQQANIFRIPGLTTASTTDFMGGVKELLRFTEETVAEVSHSHRVVFNLTGGFKSLLGVMTTLGTFYADEIVYVFELSPDLIRIPRLPIKLDNGLITDHAAVMLRMAQDDYRTAVETAQLPPALLESVGENRYGLSVWGELIWSKFKEGILIRAPIDLPRLQYETSFRRDFQNLEKTDKVQLQETLARIGSLLEESNGSREALLGDRAGGIKYEQYKGKNRQYCHFRFGGGLRVSCKPVDGKLILRHCGQHDYVNDNP